MRGHFWVVAILCLVGLAVLGGSTALAQPPQSAAASAYVVEQGQAAGGGYQLAAGTWQVSGTAGGPGYHVQSSILQAAGCCCTFLPCLMRP